MKANRQFVSSDRTAASLGQVSFEMALKMSRDPDSVREAREFFSTLVAQNGMGALAKKHQVDACLSAFGPAHKPPNMVPPPDSLFAASIGGTPILSVPTGRADGLPTGLLLHGPAWSDDKLRYAYAYEQATHHRKPPLH